MENVITTSSDHLAVSISLEGMRRHDAPVQQQFRFEAAWLHALDYREVMEWTWLEGRDRSHSLQATYDNLHRLAGSLKRWSHDSFDAIKKKIRRLEHKLKYMHCSNADHAEIRKVEKSS